MVDLKPQFPSKAVYFKLPIFLFYTVHVAFEVILKLPKSPRKEILQRNPWRTPALVAAMFGEERSLELVTKPASRGRAQARSIIQNKTESRSNFKRTDERRNTTV